MTHGSQDIILVLGVRGDLPTGLPPSEADEAAGAWRRVVRALVLLDAHGADLVAGVVEGQYAGVIEDSVLGGRADRHDGSAAAARQVGASKLVVGGRADDLRAEGIGASRPRPRCLGECPSVSGTGPRAAWNRRPVVGQDQRVFGLS